MKCVVAAVQTRAVEAPKKKAVKKAPATGGCSRLLRRLYIVNAAKRLQGDRPCSCDHFEMRLTSVRPSVQKLSAFEIKNIYLHAYSRNLVDFSAKIFRKVHRKCMCQQFPTCPFTNTLHSTIFLDPILPSSLLSQLQGWSF